ncbi:MAG: hypothetical protein NVS2B7_19140 [Herpetosiphon sp.]
MSVATDGEERPMALPDALQSDLPYFPLASLLHPTVLAWKKCKAASETHSGFILGADTIVVLDDTIFGKPDSPETACGMLQRLQGRQHTVYTGLALLNSSGAYCRFGLDRALVTMAPLDATTIAEYVATGEPMDKAGAYGIQGLGGSLVTAVDGSCSCIIGLPLGKVHRLLVEAGWLDLVDPAAAFARWRTERGKDGPPCTAP